MQFLMTSSNTLITGFFYFSPLIAGRVKKVLRLFLLILFANLICKDEDFSHKQSFKWIISLIFNFSPAKSIILFLFVYFFNLINSHSFCLFIKQKLCFTTVITYKAINWIVLNPCKSLEMSWKWILDKIENSITVSYLPAKQSFFCF